jgi:hypothetical protein
MAAIPVTIVGMMSYSGLEVGGGPLPGGPDQPPVYPAHPIAPGGPPPTVMPPIYYPPVYPAHPIAGPPEWGHHPAHPIAPGGPPPTVMPPIYYPPVISGPPGPWPTPPIALPPEQPPGEIPPGPGSGGGSWNFYPQLGWVWTSPGGKWHYLAGDKPTPPQVPVKPPEGGTPPEQPPVDPNAPVVTPH